MKTPEFLRPHAEKDRFSPWWRYGLLVVFIVGFGTLIWISAGAYRHSPPIPERVTDPSGKVLFTGEDIVSGQALFLENGLMDNGTLWGHGSYLGPDFSATYLHRLTLDVGEGLLRDGAVTAAADGTVPVSLDEPVGRLLSTNRYNAETHELAYTRYEADSFVKQIDLWKGYLSSPVDSRGLLKTVIYDPTQTRQVTAFFSWAAWAAAAHVPGKSYSYTINFPYDPAADNGPNAEAILWSVLSLVALLGGTGVVLFAFGRFDYLGWHGVPPTARIPSHSLEVTPSQRAVMKYFVVVMLLFLAQTLVGSATSHYRADPQSFFGFDLASLLPSNLLRAWHLQTAIFWIATAYIGGGLLMASIIGKKEPKRQALFVHILFWALFAVVGGSLLGILLGNRRVLGKLSFWIGMQGWEYLELGRIWQYAMIAGFVLWVVLLFRAVGKGIRDPERKELNRLFLAAAISIPLFYLPAFFFDNRTNYTVADTWRFWIVHLWVEGFFELFATTLVAMIFFNLNMVAERTAKRVIYLDGILFLGAGIIGTGHHWYWTGQTMASLAFSAVFSAMEVIPLILLTLDAWSFVSITRGQPDAPTTKSYHRHRWAFRFLIAVGVWNFVGAGIFGFLLNMPIVSYYETGTNLTPNHGHAALMGVFGMLALAVVVYAVRHVSDDRHWKNMEPFIRVSFIGLNAGLAGMVVLNLFPVGVLQILDVVRNGYWHARSAAFLDQPLVRTLEWMRLPADLVFILAGVAPLLIAATLTWLHSRKPVPLGHDTGI